MRGTTDRPSLRARILVHLLRRWVKPRSIREPDPVASRAFVERLALPLGLVRARPGTVGGVEGEWLERDRSPAGTLVYIHGGAYVVCSPRTHRPVTAAFARHGFRVFAPDYRRAPEHRFPAALDDVVATCRGLLEAGTSPAELVLAGESAGGALAVSALLRLRDLGLPLPAGAALFSPWTDLALTGPSLRANEARDAMFFPRHAAAVAHHYLGDADPRTPLASPLYAELSGLPPLLIHVGGTEILLDDSLRLARRAREVGVEVELKVWPDVPHGWQVFGPLLPETRASLAEAGAFLHARIKAAAALRAGQRPAA